MSIPTIELTNVPAELPAGVTVLDVREDDEWQAGHIEGAVHIPLSLLPVRAGELPEGELLVICKAGGRSAQACTYLSGQGHQVVNVAGGMLEWAGSGRPMVSETGDAPTVL